MNADQNELGTSVDVDDLTERVIGCAFEVSNTLGCGFLEKVYENALVHELRLGSVPVEQQLAIPVFYKGMRVGDYIADVVVANTVFVELKACDRLNEVHMAQCLNYLRATQLPNCLLLNFGKPRVEIKRLRF
jgi:GxxExxY protein